MKKFYFFFVMSFQLTWLSAQDASNTVEGNKELYTLTDSLRFLDSRFRSGELEESRYNELRAEILNQIGELAYSNYEEIALSNSTPNPYPGVQDPVSPEIASTDTVPEFTPGPDFGSSRSPMGLLSGNKKRTSFKIRYGMYWNSLSSGTSNSQINYPKWKTGSSYNWFGEFDILLNTRLGKEESPWSIYYGIGFDNRCFKQKDEVQQLYVESEKAVFKPSQNKIDQAKIQLGFFRIPVGLQFKKNKFAWNLGGYVGFNTYHEQILNYTETDGAKAELTLDKDYDFTKTIYGLSTSIGFKRIHLGFNYDLNSLFKNSVDYDYNAWRVGLLIF